MTAYLNYNDVVDVDMIFFPFLDDENGKIINACLTMCNIQSEKIEHDLIYESTAFDDSY
jgi:hypothetical protein